MKKLMILLASLSVASFGAMAQEDKNDKNDRIEAYKIAFITERLDLTPKESAAFWPIYNEYMDQMRKSKAKEKERSKAFTDKTAPTDAESEKFISDHLSNKQQEQELSRKYIAEFKRVLPIAKVAKLITLEQEFKHKLLKQLGDKKKGVH
jgi:Spy/CpxP family protein refolding chaperone